MNDCKHTPQKKIHRNWMSKKNMIQKDAEGFQFVHKKNVVVTHPPQQVSIGNSFAVLNEVDEHVGQWVEHGVS